MVETQHHLGALPEVPLQMSWTLSFITSASARPKAVEPHQPKGEHADESRSRLAPSARLDVAVRQPNARYVRWAASTTSDFGMPATRAPASQSPPSATSYKHPNPQAAPMPETQTRLQLALSDRYRIEREIGAGGMATVFLAQDLRHDRRVALKLLRPELSAVIGAERFLAEIKLTANLQHPHILPLFDSGEVVVDNPEGAQRFLFYVMPFVEGESLRARLNREKQLPVAEAVRIAVEVASALDYAHRHGVVHRDIKPENILLHDGQALVADFGIALAASKAGGNRMTETGMSLGTPHYMSPEQAMGEREITARSDVYALGVVLYEMLTGDPPFTGSTAQAIVARVLTEPPRPILPQRHTIPPEVEGAILVALEKLPADRFASAAEFAEALEGRSTDGTRPLIRRNFGELAIVVGPVVHRDEHRLHPGKELFYWSSNNKMMSVGIRPGRPSASSSRARCSRRGRTCRAGPCRPTT